MPEWLSFFPEYPPPPLARGSHNSILVTMLSCSASESAHHFQMLAKMMHGTLHCVICEKRNSKVCTRCKAAAYCSAEWQKKEWLFHKLLCSSFAKFELSKRTCPDHFGGFRFPEDDGNPVCILMKCKVLDGVEGLYRYMNLETGVVNFCITDMARALMCSQDTECSLQRHVPQERL